MVNNPNWQSGMASSIACGLTAQDKWYPETEAVILMVCDQPFVNPKLLMQLSQKHEESGNSIVASSYANIQGTPALFHKKHFNELLAIEGDTGARSLIKKYTGSIQSVPFIRGGIDIDTIEDYQNLLK